MMSDTLAPVAPRSVPLPAKLRQYYALTKPRVVQLIVFCALIGMLLATPGLPDWHRALPGVAGIWLVAAAAAAFNCLVEQRIDARMKRTAYLVNTTRGAVVDEAALAWALRERLIAGAALDVFEREPVVHVDLLALENVVLAPHLGSATRETRLAMADLAVRNVIAVLTGQAALTPIV